MQIQYHRNFEKRYKRLPSPVKKKVILCIKKFILNPYDVSLKNHGLKGNLPGKRAICVTSDIRIIFEELDGYILVIFLAIGTHNQVYK